MMSPAAMSLFHLRQLLTLFVSELGGHLAMRVGNDLVNTSARFSPNFPGFRSCFVDDRGNLDGLFRGQVEFSTESFFHSSANPLGMVQLKEMMPRVGSPYERAGDSTRDKHQKEARD